MKYFLSGSNSNYLVIYQGWCVFRSILIIKIKNIMELKWPNKHVAKLSKKVIMRLLYSDDNQK